MAHKVEVQERTQRAWLRRVPAWAKGARPEGTSRGALWPGDLPVRPMPSRRELPSGSACASCLEHETGDGARARVNRRPLIVAL
jgi:hypothetical protein